MKISTCCVLCFKAAVFVFFFLQNTAARAETLWDVLSESERQIHQNVLNRWAAWIPERKTDGTAPMITFEDLYNGLTAEEIAFCERVRSIDPQKDFNFQGGFLGNDTSGVNFIRLDDQWITKNGEPFKINPQYVPENVYRAYLLMMDQMERDIGKRLWIESGYRSGAYQLYTFLHYLPEHHYSLVETGQWVAIPGYSEHGYPAGQALDFINSDGINGDDEGQTVEDFENLPEYTWLEENANRYGFELSYPRGQEGITFEPWHWRFKNSEA